MKLSTLVEEVTYSVKLGEFLGNFSMEAIKMKMVVVVWRRMHRGWLLGKKVDSR